MKLYEVHETDSSIHLVMELIEGDSLQKVLKSRDFKAKHSDAQIIKMMHAIIDALSYLASKGIMHRDLKPDNILVNKEGKIKDRRTLVLRPMLMDRSYYSRNVERLATLHLRCSDIVRNLQIQRITLLAMYSVLVAFFTTCKFMILSTCIKKIHRLHGNPLFLTKDVSELLLLNTDFNEQKLAFICEANNINTDYGKRKDSKCFYFSYTSFD